jgi:thiosulfate/3-mercaptopyruvate sulfurtransferase
MQAEELKALLDQNTPRLKVIDLRHKAKYYLGHIPGAIQVWRQEIEDKRQPGLIPSAVQIEKLMDRLGISNQDTLVIYSDRFDHARLWWLLAYYGFPLGQMRLLDGGLEAWKTRGYPTQLTAPHAGRTTFRLPAGAKKDYLLATLNEVKGNPGGPEKVILDARSQRQYLGKGREEGSPRPGHIPGAVWVEWKEAKVADGPFKGFFKRVEEIKEIYSAQGITPDKNIYIYSNLGRRAAFSLVSLYLAGYPLEKLHLYGGSWIEWSRSQEPAETGYDHPAETGEEKPPRGD